MTCERFQRLVGLCVILCAAGWAPTGEGAQDFHRKASMLSKEEPESPKCFAENKKDLTCFWEEDEERAGPVDQYSFTYAYQKENSSTCPLTVVPAAGGKKFFICRIKHIQMFVKLDIQVHREEMLIHNRSLFAELVFLLDPPKNVTASRTASQGQLNVSWVPPALKYLDDSLMYEVLYAPADSHVGQVMAVQACSEFILRGLRAATKYRVQVRVKLDGVAYNGYWSVWSDPVYMETLPAELDPLKVSLSFIISFILVVLCLVILVSHHRFILQKVWPTIPTPDSKFQDLFTIYGGDFQEWLGQTNGRFWLTSAFIYSEECPSPLEVLSEFDNGPSLVSPPVLPKALKTFAVIQQEDGGAEKGLLEGRPLDRSNLEQTNCWGTTPHDLWLLDRIREVQRHPVPSSHSSLLESQDTYIKLNGKKSCDKEPMVDTAEEAVPLEVLFTTRKTPSSDSHSDLGSAPQTSGSGHLSSESSFEDQHHVWAPKEPSYTYMAVADSGVSMDYSPMSRTDDIGKVAFYVNDYQNDIRAHRRLFLARQYPVYEDG